MFKIIILVIFLTSCAKKSWNGKYFWERPQQREIAERRPGREIKPKNTPHFEPIRGHNTSNELVWKYHLLYNWRRYNPHRQHKKR